MLKEAYMAQLGHAVSEKDCVIVCREKGNDELAPSKKLFWKFYNLRKQVLEKHDLHYEGKPDIELEARLHNQAFVDSGYPTTFREQILTDPEAMKKLKAIVERSKVEDVYLVCYEGWAKACHRRILLDICRTAYGADVEIRGIIL